MMGWIGNPPRELTTHLSADSNFAGCPYTLRSTTGEHHSIQGTYSRFPWAAAAHGQTALAQSTPESETAAVNSAMRSKGERALDIWQLLIHP